jgi:hypothetical protein
VPFLHITHAYSSTIHMMYFHNELEPKLAVGTGGSDPNTRNTQQCNIMYK